MRGDERSRKIGRLLRRGLVIIERGLGFECDMGREWREHKARHGASLNFKLVLWRVVIHEVIRPVQPRLW